MTSLAGLIPVLGGALQPGVQWALERGNAKLLQQFLEEVAACLHRLEQRMGHVELDAFLSRATTAAALNATLGLAAKTSSREKHRILAKALINCASSPDDTLHPLFWSLVEHHSPLDVRLLRCLSDPLNLAVEAGYTFDRFAIKGECIFAVVPEVRFGRYVEREFGQVELVTEDGDEDDDEASLGDEPRHPPGPYFLLRNAIRRLDNDGLIEIGKPAADQLDEYCEAVLVIGDEARGADGRYPERAFGASTELGARYLAFLTEPSAPDAITREQV